MLRMLVSPRCLIFPIVVFTSAVYSIYSSNHCRPDLEGLKYNLRDAFEEQPRFVNVVPKTEELMSLDNICQTYFPLPEDPNTYEVYISRVKSDGAFSIRTYLAKDIEIGVYRVAGPACTFTAKHFGYAGCDTYVIYDCVDFGDCNFGGSGPYVFGLSSSCRPLTLSCLRKLEEIVEQNNIEMQDSYALPMKLPNRCVFQPACINIPNPFFNFFSKEKAR